MPFWIVSLPLIESKERTWNTLQQKTVYEQDIAFNSRLEIPELKMGTLDSLLVLSDDMVRACQSMDAIVGKLRRTLQDMSPEEDGENLRVQGQNLESYIQKFRWNEAKYPVRRSLKETVEALSAEVQSIEDDLKGRLADYNQLKQQLGQIARKAQGSLAVRDLANLVAPRDVVNTENLQTVFVVVSKFATSEWATSYENLVPAQEGRPSFIVPRSSKLVAEDNEYACFSVVIFKRVMDDFKLAARAKGYQVREVDFSSTGTLKPEEVEAMKQDADRKRASLEEWLRTAYSESFACLMHALSVRLYVESVLRYGVPPRFLAAAIRPHPKAELMVRKVLATTFGGADARYWTSSAEDARAGLMDGDVFPYVSLVLNVD